MTTIESKRTKLLVDAVFDWDLAAADEIENVIEAVIDNGTVHEDLDKTNMKSNLMKTDERACSTGDVNTRVEVHVFVSDMQMNDWQCLAVQVRVHRPKHQMDVLELQEKKMYCWAV